MAYSSGRLLPASLQMYQVTTLIWHHVFISKGMKSLLRKRTC